MEKHASLMGLGAMNNTALAVAIQGQIGTDVKIAYSQPQLAGGIFTSADTYTRFLRKVIEGQLRISALLGSHPVCTNPRTCAQAVFAPLPPNESWHHSVGHWVEDDPAVGDGAFSSPGAFGFYPWVDAVRSPGAQSLADRNGVLIDTARAPPGARGSPGRSLRRYDGKKSTGQVTTI
jgi:hypothetical protein